MVKKVVQFSVQFNISDFKTKAISQLNLIKYTVQTLRAYNECQSWSLKSLESIKFKAYQKYLFKNIQSLQGDFCLTSKPMLWMFKTSRRPKAHDAQRVDCCTTMPGGATSIVSHELKSSKRPMRRCRQPWEDEIFAIAWYYYIINT